MFDIYPGHTVVRFSIWPHCITKCHSVWIEHSVKSLQSQNSENVQISRCSQCMQHTMVRTLCFSMWPGFSVFSIMKVFQINDRFHTVCITLWCTQYVFLYLITVYCTVLVTTLFGLPSVETEFMWHSTIASTNMTSCLPFSQYRPLYPFAQSQTKEMVLPRGVYRHVPFPPQGLGWQGSRTTTSVKLLRIKLIIKENMSSV